jgi:hypothetical protein
MGSQSELVCLLWGVEGCHIPQQQALGTVVRNDKDTLARVFLASTVASLTTLGAFSRNFICTPGCPLYGPSKKVMESA